MSLLLDNRVSGAYTAALSLLFAVLPGDFHVNNDDIPQQEKFQVHTKKL